jgi:AcrR family transcriptional regulator
MARPRSEDKRNAILAAATHVFAERGLGSAPTSEISRQAGVAEGTLFTYFKTKDDLVNALYREIKLELADAMMSGFPRKRSLRFKLQHIWDGYVNWGLANPEPRKVIQQLQVSDLITQESREAGMAPFAEIAAMTQDAIVQRAVRDDLPLEFIAKTLEALADATMEFIALHPSEADKYRASGFEMFWAGIARK